MTDSSPRYFPPGPGMVPPMAERTVNFLVFKNDAPNLACMLKRLLSAFFLCSFWERPPVHPCGSHRSGRPERPDCPEKTARQLNIVYFLGSDTEPVPDYERRLSELLLYLQQFYGKEMQRHGYGARSFGLDIKSPGRVNIIEYKAKNPAAHYPYENGGGWKAAQELDEFFKAHPDRKKASTRLSSCPPGMTKRTAPTIPAEFPFTAWGATVSPWIIRPSTSNT